MPKKKAEKAKELRVLTQCRFPPAELAAWKDKAADQGLTLTEYLRQAANFFLQREDLAGRVEKLERKLERLSE